jgi:hypothetical protein
MIHSLRLWFPLACVALAAFPLSCTAGTPASGNGLAAILASAAPKADPGVIELATRALYCAEETDLARNPPTLSVIDYSRPSTQPRLWVFDLGQQRLLFEELVAHGRNTGGNQAVHFSNAPGSLMSSIGVFVTADTYIGHNGYSLHLRGLEPGFNDHALDREIVIHGAAYVDPAIAGNLGRLGRSFGCPAVRPVIARPLIDAIRGGSLVVAYYPDQAWLHGSALVGNCALGASAAKSDVGVLLAAGLQAAR